MSRPYLVYLGGVYSVESVPAVASAGGTLNFIEWLEPIHLTHCANGEIGELRCIAHRHVEDANATVHLHQAIQLRNAAATLVFSGVVVKKHIVLQGETEKFELVAYNNAEYFLHRMCCRGQFRLQPEKEQELFDLGINDDAPEGISVDSDYDVIDTPLIFNPNGLGNASGQVFYDTDVGSSNTFRLFDAPGRYQANADGEIFNSVPWSLSDAIKYLLNVYKVQWAIAPSSVSESTLDVFETHGDPLVSNVNLEGKSLLNALTTLCEPHNYEFFLSSQASGSPAKHTITFRFRGGGDSIKTISLSARGTGSDVSTSNLIALDVTVDSTPVVNSLVALGDQINVTTLAHSHPSDDEDAPVVVPLDFAWKADDLVFAFNDDGTVNWTDTDFTKNYRNPNLIDTNGVYGIGRLWVVNQGQVPDFPIADLTTDLGHRTSVDPRVLDRPGIYNRNGSGGILKQEELIVEASFDEGENWMIVERNWYRVLTNAMGIVFTDPFLEKLGPKAITSGNPTGKNYWQALYEEKVQLRILCSINCDRRVQSIQPNGGEAVPLATLRVFDNAGYRKLEVNDSIDDALYFTRYTPLKATADDTSGLQAIVDVQYANTNRLLITGTAVVLLETFGAYKPCDEIEGITGRSLTFPTRATIQRVVYDFPSQHVQLVLDNRRIKSVITARPIHNNRDEERLRLTGGVTQADGTQVPYLPGVRSSRQQYFREGGE